MMKKMEHEQRLAMRMVFFILVCVMMIVACIIVLARAETITQQSNVSITCNNQSQCVLIPYGSGPIIFTALENNITVPVSLSFTYQQNVTVVQNLTVIQNITTVNVTTQNVTVVDCNLSVAAPIINVSIEKFQQDLSNTINANLATACQNACSIGNSDRQVLEQQAKDANAQVEITRVNCEAAINITNMQMAHVNSTLTAENESLKTNIWELGFLCVLCLGIASVCVIYIARKTRQLPKATGQKGALSPAKR